MGKQQVLCYQIFVVSSDGYGIPAATTIKKVFVPPELLK